MEEQILGIIKDSCDDKIVLEKRDIDLFDTGLLDSMSFIELLITFEEEFGIEITPDEIKKEDMRTPNKILQFVQKRIK